MKSKIALIILLLIILILGGLDIFFGYKYSSQRNINTDMKTKVNYLNSKIENLNTQIEELNKLNEDTQNSTESNETNNETQSLKIYANANNTLLLYLIQNDNPPSLSGFVDNMETARYILVWRAPQAMLEEITGYYIEENGTLKLNILGDNGLSDTLNHNFGVTVEDTNSGSKNLVCSYDSENIIFGNETFTRK